MTFFRFKPDRDYEARYRLDHDGTWPHSYQGLTAFDAPQGYQTLYAYRAVIVFSVD